MQWRKLIITCCHWLCKKVMYYICRYWCNLWDFVFFRPVLIVMQRIRRGAASRMAYFCASIARRFTEVSEYTWRSWGPRSWTPIGHGYSWETCSSEEMLELLVIPLIPSWLMIIIYSSIDIALSKHFGALSLIFFLYIIVLKVFFIHCNTKGNVFFALDAIFFFFKSDIKVAVKSVTNLWSACWMTHFRKSTIFYFQTAICSG